MDEGTMKEGTFICKYCEKHYFKRKRLFNHLLMLHKVEKDPEYANSDGFESSYDSCTDYESDTEKTSISAGGVTKSPANVSLNKKQSNQAQLGKVIIEKKNESSSDSSSSEDEKVPKTSKTPMKVAISLKQSPKVAKKSSPELFLIASTDSEDDDPKTAAKTPMKVAISLKQSPKVEKKSSPELILIASTDSEDDDPKTAAKTPMKVAISLKQSPKVEKKSSPKLILISSSDSEDDDPKTAAELNTPTKNKIPIKGSFVTLIQKIPPYNVMVKKGDSSDSSSDSEDEIQVQPKKNPNESGNWAPKISKFAAEFSDDYSESERVKVVMVSLAKKVPISKSPVTKQVSLGAGLPPSVTALKRTIHDMSDSEDSEDSSDSSDSDAGKGTNKSLNKKPQLTPKPAIATPSKKPAASIKSKKDSSDSSSDSSEEETSVNLLNKKNRLNKSSSKSFIAPNSAFYTAIKPSPKKQRISTSSKKDYSDSVSNKDDILGSESEEELFKQPLKMPVPHPSKGNSTSSAKCCDCKGAVSSPLKKSRLTKCLSDSLEKWLKAHDYLQERREGVDASTQTEEIKTDGNDSESEVSSVSSIHTSDLSSFDDLISLSSEDENGEKKTVPLKEALKKYLK